VQNRLDPQSVGDYLGRGWREAKALDRAHWLAERQRRGSAATIEVARALHEHMRAVRPDWPTAHDVQLDLEHQVRLKALLDKTVSFVIRR
jgi:hypothetical protein